MFFFLACADPADSGKDPADSDPNDSDSGGSDSDSGSDDSGDSGDSGETRPAGLPDAREDMAANADACQEIGGSSSVRGGQVYYWAELVQEGDRWVGQEAWYYFVNDAWAEAGGVDCVVLWDIAFTEGSTGACGDCDLGLEFAEATIAADSSCSEDAIAGYDISEEVYAVRRGGGGVADWYFPGSGGQFGSGWWVEGAVNYLSDGGCEVASF